MLYLEVTHELGEEVGGWRSECQMQEPKGQAGFLEDKGGQDSSRKDR